MHLLHIILPLMLSFLMYGSTAFTLSAGSVVRGSKRLHKSPLVRLASSSTGGTAKGPIPVTILSGFLGAGKTTFLQHTLANRDGKKFGLIVNDMATVNVDAKQIRAQTFDSSSGITTMELQDGCVCCNLSEDMFASLSNLLTVADLKKETYDHIVVECSGIAEPRKLRDAFQSAEDYKLDFTKKLQLDTLVTLVDATVFLDLFGTVQNFAANRHLAYQDKQDPADKNTYVELDGSDQRVITELLLEQVECADIVIINKCDLLKNVGDVDLVRKVISSINPSARVYDCVQGKVVDPVSLIGSAHGKGAADWGILDEHRHLIKAVEKEEYEAAELKKKQEKKEEEICHVASCTDPTHHHHHDHSHSHSHSHEHGHGHSHKHTASGETIVCQDCTDPTHHHDLAHNDKHAASSESAVCQDTSCKDPTHHHDHAHSHNDSSPKEQKPHDPATCTDPTHDHSHSHPHAHGHSADHDEATCTDPTHNHNHSPAHGHSHSPSDATTAERRFGITSFVYKRRRPFHPIRFSVFLQTMGTLSVSGVADMSKSLSAQAPSTAPAEESSESIVAQLEAAKKAQQVVLRSKGFAWLSSSSQAAYFMSHAGQYMHLQVLGRWWAAIDPSQWPADVQSEITVDFQGTHGDRRQEMVFIGQFGKRGGVTQQELEAVLDDCLLTDTEMKEYEKISQEGDDALKAHFAPGY